MPLKIALIDSDPDRAEALRRQLSAEGFAHVYPVPGGPDLVRTIEAIGPDLVIVDMALPDRDALESVRAVSSAHPIVMFADGDPKFAEEAIAAGVCSYNLSGSASSNVKPIVMSAIALFRRHRRVEDELQETKALLEERRLIERAKAILMRNRKMTEPEAYAWLRRKAMNESKKIGTIASALVNKEDRNVRK